MDEAFSAERAEWSARRGPARPGEGARRRAGVLLGGAGWPREGGMRGIGFAEVCD